MATTYETEEQQVEELKKWWKENGKSVVAGIMIGFALLAGWRWWQNYTEQQAQIASGFYEQVLSSIEKEELEKARGFAGKLLSDHGSSPYAVLTALNLAHQDIKQDDIESAHARLQWAIDQNSGLTELTHIARLRKARLFLSQAKLAEAKSLVESVETKKFQGAYADIRGDIAIAEGQLEVARTAYDEALASEQLSTQHQKWVQIKRDDLGSPKEERLEANSPLSDSGNPSTTQEDSFAISESEATPVDDSVTPAESKPVTPSATSDDELETSAEVEPEKPSIPSDDDSGVSVEPEPETPSSISDDSGVSTEPKPTTPNPTSDDKSMPSVESELATPSTTSDDSVTNIESEPATSGALPADFFNSLKLSDFAATPSTTDAHKIIESTGETPSTTQQNTLTIPEPATQN